MERAFTSLAELRTEIDLLKIRRFQQEELLKEKVKDPAALFATAKNYFTSRPSGNKSLMQNLLNQDIVTNVARFILPLLLNRTFFKRSGFITKTIVTFLSNRAASQVNSSRVNTIVDKVKSWFQHKKQQRTQKAYVREYTRDYGIPPDSETY